MPISDKRHPIFFKLFVFAVSLIFFVSNVSPSFAQSGGANATNESFLGHVFDFFFRGNSPTISHQLAQGVDANTGLHTKAVEGITIDANSLTALQNRVSTLELQFGQISQQTSPSTITIDTAGGNLLRNSSFEAGGTGNIPSQWNAQLDSNSGNTFTSAEGIHSGSLGLKFNGGVTGNFGISQPSTKTTPQRTYTLSAWVKVINAPNATFRIGFWDEYNNREGSFKNIGISGTKDWFRVSTTVTTPGVITNNTNYFPMFEVQGLTSGAVYMDDVMLTEGSALIDYNTAQANAGTSALALGDGSILGHTVK